MSVERFRRAQDDQHAGFDAALSELRAGRKNGHWIWYIFPQLDGLGMSQMSRTFGIHGPAEANEYLRDPVLRGRLVSTASVVRDQLRAGVPLARLMGSSIDAVKLVSSMTLFGEIAARMQDREVAEVASEILTAAETQGHPRCETTLRSL